MKLIWRVALRQTLLTAFVLGGWAVFFYSALVKEIRGEVDDALSDYAELLIVRSLAGQPLPVMPDGSNNSYRMEPVSEAYAAAHRVIDYRDTEVYIPEREETQPARLLTTLFRDGRGHWWELAVATPTFETQSLLAKVLGWTVFLYVVLLAAIVGLTMWVFRRSMRPLYGLLAWLDDYEVGHARPLDNPTTVAEFRRLNEAAGQAAERADRLYEQQKQFIGNASHELQTPLAVCRGRLEWLLDHAELTEEQAREVFTALGALDRAVKLNRTLLLLARIDSGRFPEVEPTDFRPLVREQVAQCDERYASRRVVARIEETSPFVPVINSTLAVTVVSNLVRNAYLHNRPGGCVTVRLAADSFEVVNDATAGPLDPERIFERFWQGAGSTGSAGLGLPLVEAACRASGLAIAYDFCEGRHVFTVTMHA